MPPAEYLSQGAHSAKEGPPLLSGRKRSAASRNASDAIVEIAVSAAVVLVMLGAVVWLAYRSYRRQVQHRKAKGRIDLRMIPRRDLTKGNPGGPY